MKPPVTPRSVAEHAPCQVCGNRYPTTTMLSIATLRHAVVERILRDHPDLDSSGCVCASCNARYRADYVREILEEERGELTSLDDEVIAAMRDQELIADNLNETFAEHLTVGQRIADRVASFGGSWTFILLFGGIIVVWVAINIGLILAKPFDPYPFILLNLVLSMLAAMQAPVIMMSQNRHAAKDRLQAENDYRINLKAELEVRLLHTKVDQLVTHQWQRLIEIQQLQMDLMEELRAERNGDDTPPTR